MGSPFLKYVRRSEALWMALSTRSSAEGAKVDVRATCSYQLAMSLSLERTRDTPFVFAIGGTGKARRETTGIYLALNLRRESFGQPSRCPVWQHDNVARSVLPSEPSAVALVESTI
jgi:hypothetical protein